MAANRGFSKPRLTRPAILMIQLLVGPLSSKIESDFSNLTYQAIDD